MSAIDNQFREWVASVYDQAPQGDQAAQIEMAFFAGVLACGVVMRQVGGLDAQTASPQCKAAMSEIGQDLMAHLLRVKTEQPVKH